MLVVISKMETTDDDMIKGRVNQFDLHVLYVLRFILITVFRDYNP